MFGTKPYSSPALVPPRWLGALAATIAWAGGASVCAAADDHATSEVVLTLAPGTTCSIDASRTNCGIAAVDAVAHRHGVLAMRPLIPAARRAHRAAARFEELGLGRMVRFAVADAASAERLAAALRGLPMVTGASVPARATAAKTPNDPLFPNQWSLQAGRVGCPKAWNIESDATGVPVAILDTGADLKHTDFKSNRWINVGEISGNGIDDDGNGYVDDRYGFDFVNRDGDPTDDEGHGTAVAGVVAATGDNFSSICGVCWVAEAMTLKVLDATGTGSLADIAEGLVYAVDNGARVANLSLTATVDDATLRAAVDYAAAADVVTVAAAGNDGSTSPRWPAAYDAVIGVVATDENDLLWASSNHGNWCELGAPGTNILTLKNGGGTEIISGTSFAAPHVAGVAALMRKVNAQLDRTAILLALEQSAADLGKPGYDSDFSWGRLAADAALEMARSLSAASLDVNSGSSVNLDLREAADPSFLYILLPSTQGRMPGMALAAFDPTDFRVLPLNADPLQGWVLANPGNPVFQNFLGSLDLTGHARATFAVPPRLWRGTDLDFAFVTLDPADLSTIVHLSAPLTIHVH